MSKLKLSSVKSERKRIESGDWIEYTPWASLDGKVKPRFRVRGISSSDFVKATSDLIKEFATKCRGDTIPDDIAYRRNAELTAEYLLIDWDGFDEPYSVDRATELLVDRDYEKLHEAVRWCAQRLEQISTEFTDDAVKNSEAPSATS